MNSPGMIVKPHVKQYSSYMPFKSFVIDGLDVNLVEIFDSFDMKFNESTIKTIKSHLARGIPVVGLAYFKYAADFNDYNGDSYLEQTCEASRSAD